MDYTPQQQDILEIILPEYLKQDIISLEEGRINDSALLDCLYCEVQGSINLAFYNHEITEAEASFLRKKHLGLEGS